MNLSRHSIENLGVALAFGVNRIYVPSMLQSRSCLFSSYYLSSQSPFALVARLAERLNLMRLVFRDEVIMYHEFNEVKYLKYILINQLVQLVIIL